MYHLKSMAGNDIYLFYPWLSGDVIYPRDKATILCIKKSFRIRFGKYLASKAIGSFIAALIIAEILSKIAIWQLALRTGLLSSA